MRKKAVVTMLASSMLCLVLAGCGGSKGADTAAKEADSQKTVEATQAEETTKPEETTQPAEEKTEEASEGEVDVVLDEGIDKYEGSWFEEIAGRGSMEISPSGDGKYYIEVSWSSSAAELSVWNFTAIYDGESGDLVYDDGSYQSILFDEEGNETVQEEKSVQGFLHLVEDNRLEWTDNAFDSSEPSVFVR